VTTGSRANQQNDPCDICVGQIAAPHGLEGEVAVEPLTEYPERLAPGAEVFVNGAGGRHALAVVATRPHRGRLLVHFAGVESREAAEELRGVRLLIRRSQLAPLPPGRYYEFQIVGLVVRTEQGKQLGRVQEILHTGANDVYVTEQVLVPALAAAVAKIDLEAGEMVLRDEAWAVATGAR